MNEQSPMNSDDYYAEAGSWNSDRVQAMHSSKRVAWWIAAIASAIALLEATALVFLTPLKTVEPYTIMVDRTTGYVQALKPLDQARVSPDASLTQSFLYQYVIARESFDKTTLRADYRKVALFSADTARASYLQTMQASNPQNPLQLYPRSTTVDVRVKSVSPIGPHEVLVRFDRIRRDGTAQPQAPRSWVAAIRYRYSNQPMSIEDRFENPLGFQVTNYRKDPEAPPPLDSNFSIAAPAVTSPVSPDHPPPMQFAPRRPGAER